MAENLGEELREEFQEEFGEEFWEESRGQSVYASNASNAMSHS